MFVCLFVLLSTTPQFNGALFGNFRIHEMVNVIHSKLCVCIYNNHLQLFGKRQLLGKLYDNDNKIRLAYSDESGIVLVDIVQKSVILSATLSDLYSSNLASIGQNRADISIQPFATNSILQHHYKSNANPLSTTAPTAAPDQSQIATKQPSSSSSSPNQTTLLNNDTNTATDNTSESKLRNADAGSLGNINKAVLPLHKVNASTAESSAQVSFSKLFLLLPL